MSDVPEISAAGSVSVRSFDSSVHGIDKLAVALAKAQGEFPTLTKNKTAAIKTDRGSEFSFGYADLATVIETIKAVLSKNGICYSQFPSRDIRGGTVSVQTVLFCGDQYMSATLEWPIPKDDARGIGSAITYARRYGLVSILGLAAEDEDDDGEAASRAVERETRSRRQRRGRDDRDEPAQPESRGGEERITVKNADGTAGGQKGRLLGILREHGVDMKAFGAHLNEKYGYQSWTEIRQKHFDEIVSLAQAWPRPAAVAGPRDPGVEG